MIGYPLILGTNGFSLENHSGIMCSCRSIEKRVMSMAWGTTINITNGQLQIHLSMPSLSKFMLAIIIAKFGWSNHAVSAQPKQKRKYIWQLTGCRNRVVKSESRLNLSQHKPCKAKIKGSIFTMNRVIRAATRIANAWK